MGRVELCLLLLAGIHAVEADGLEAETLMALLPQPQHTTVVKIYEHYEKANGAWKPRPHLGASLIGNKCERALWYSFRWATWVKFQGRMLRLFDTGNREEFRLVVDLRNAGVTVYDKDPATGKQFEFKDHGGHFSGSMDAAMQGLEEAFKTWHVGEFKTHNAKSFAELTKKGVKEAKPLHWHQMNTYMGWSAMKRAAYFAVCKDTDEIYIERIEFDQVSFERDRAKALRVISAGVPPARISNDPSWFECKFCDHHAVCHVGRAPMVSCRTCVHSTPLSVDDATASNGAWDCDKHKKKLNYVDGKGEQIDACGDHMFIPDLLAFAEVLEAGEDWISYRNRRTGKPFVNATETSNPGLDPSAYGSAELSMYTSRELHACDPQLVGDAKVNELKNTFDGKVIA